MPSCARVLRPHGEREGLPWRLFLVALFLAAMGLATWLLAPSIALSLLGRRLPLSGRGMRMIYYGLLGVGLCGGALVALAPLILFLHHFAARFDRLFERFASAYERLLRVTLKWRWAVLVLLVGAGVGSAWGFRNIGQELFPEVDAGDGRLGEGGRHLGIQVCACVHGSTVRSS